MDWRGSLIVLSLPFALISRELSLLCNKSITLRIFPKKFCNFCSTDKVEIMKANFKKDYGETYGGKSNRNKKSVKIFHINLKASWVAFVIPKVIDVERAKVTRLPWSHHTYFFSERRRVETKTYFFYLLFGCPTTYFGPISRGQLLSLDASYCVVSIFDSKVTWRLVMGMGL